MNHDPKKRKTMKTPTTTNEATVHELLCAGPDRHGYYRLPGRRIKIVHNVGFSTTAQAQRWIGGVPGIPAHWSDPVETEPVPYNFVGAALDRALSTI